jgi:hypothetical protein
MGLDGATRFICNGKEMDFKLAYDCHHEIAPAALFEYKPVAEGNKDKHKILGVECKSVQKRYTITLYNGLQVTCSPRQKFRTVRKKPDIAANKLSHEDLILCYKENTILSSRIKSIDSVKKKFLSYSLVFKNDTVYPVNGGILACGKAA